MTYTHGGRRIVASDHALRRARERVPVLRLADKHDARTWVEATAHDALVNTRTAKNMPRWCVCFADGRRTHLYRPGWARYVWNEDETACLVVQREKSLSNSEAVLLVLTVMTPDMESR